VLKPSKVGSLPHGICGHPRWQDRRCRQQCGNGDPIDTATGTALNPSKLLAGLGPSRSPHRTRAAGAGHPRA
jgi:hypothetical protein